MNIFTSYPVGHKVQSEIAHFLKVSAWRGCDSTIYLRIMMEAYHIFYRLILLMQGMSYSIIRLLI